MFHASSHIETWEKRCSFTHNVLNGSIYRCPIRLIVRQQPVKARLCSFKEKGVLHTNSLYHIYKSTLITWPISGSQTCRPTSCCTTWMSTPRVCDQIVIDIMIGKEKLIQQYMLRMLHDPNLFLYATLVDARGDDIHFTNQATPSTAGAVVQSLHKLRDTENKGKWLCCVCVHVYVHPQVGNTGC